jgi:hypothetical protein
MAGTRGVKGAMDARIQQALDGELTADQLTREEAAAVATAESLIRGVVRAVPQEPMPDLSQAVLSRLEEIEPAPMRQRGARSAWTWLWQPRQVALRPAYALAAFALAAVLLMRAPEPQTIDRAPVAQATPQVLIQFRLDAPGAQQVSLAGDFTGWQPQYAMTRSDNGAWTIVVPLSPGIHEYAFIIDGEEWVADPLAPAVEDGFGGQNSKLAVLAADSRSL